MVFGLRQTVYFFLEMFLVFDYHYQFLRIIEVAEFLRLYLIYIYIYN